MMPRFSRQRSRRARALEGPEAGYSRQTPTRDQLNDASVSPVAPWARGAQVHAIAQPQSGSPVPPPPRGLVPALLPTPPPRRGAQAGPRVQGPKTFVGLGSSRAPVWVSFGQSGLEWGRSASRRQHAQAPHHSGGLGTWGGGGGRRRTNPGAAERLRPAHLRERPLPTRARPAPAQRSALPMHLWGTSMLKGPPNLEGGASPSLNKASPIRAALRSRRACPGRSRGTGWGRA